MQQLAAVLGGKWAEKHVLPKLLAYQVHNNYLFRLIPYFALPPLLPHLSPECVEKVVAPFLLEGVKDKVPNVRFNVAKALKAAGTCVKTAPTQSAFTKALAQLAADPDSDVRYFAAKPTLPA